MTDKELIKQEIERLIERAQAERVLHPKTILSAKNYLLIEDYNKLLQFIDSLPKESGCEVNFTTKSEDLEEEFHSWMRENCDDNGFFNQLELARHFAEWQKEKHNKQFGFLNLKDCKDAYNEWKSTQDNPSAALAWVRACEWQKQKMMRDAVELHIVESFNPVGTENENPHGFTALCYNAEYPDFYPVTGQTIKIIPIKTKQQ